MVSPFRGSGPFRGRGPFLGRGPWAGKAPWGFNLGGVAWSPSSLFANGEQGAWYDPSDLTTLWQDSAGTTAVTAVEQPVGLMLDKSRGLVLGPELVDTANTAAVWTAYGSNTVTDVGDEVAITYVGGANSGFGAKLTFSQAGGLSSDLTVGRTYEFTVSCKISTGSCTPYVNLGGANFFLASVASASFVSQTFRLVASAAATGILQINNDLGAGEVFSIKNISVRELPGAHAFNPNATTVRPTLSCRYNLLTYSEQFDNAAWILSAIRAFGSGSVANAIAAPDGTITAEFVVPTTATAEHFLTSSTVAFTAGVAYKFSVYAKAGGYSWLRLALNNGFFPAAGRAAWFDLSTGALGTVQSGVTATISPVGSDGWYLCSVTATATATGPGGGNFLVITDADNTTSFTGNGTSGIYFWGADVRVANESATIPYQRVTTATDYDADPTKFPYYLSFDGSDDWLQTASIDFSTVTSDGLPRRNLLSFPTAFDDAAWAKVGLNTTGTPPWVNVITAPDGTLTADRLIEDTSNALRSVTRTVVSSGANTYTLSFYAKDAGRQWVGAYITHNFSDTAYCAFDLTNGTANVPTVAGVSVATSSVESVSGGWLRCVLTITTTGFTSPYVLIQPLLGTATSRQTYTGDGSSGVYIWGAQLETGSTATAFQNIGTDKMSVFAGVRKLSDAAAGPILESSALSTNPGAFGMFDPAGAGSPSRTYAFRSESAAAVSSPEVLSPITYVAASQADRAAPSIVIRQNGTQVGSTTATQGTGNFGNHAMYIGRRGGTTLPFNGRLYSLIVRGALSDATEITNAETYVAGKTGVTL